MTTAGIYRALSVAQSALQLDESAKHLELHSEKKRHKNKYNISKYAYYYFILF